MLLILTSFLGDSFLPRYFVQSSKKQSFKEQSCCNPHLFKGLLYTSGLNAAILTTNQDISFFFAYIYWKHENQQFRYLNGLLCRTGADLVSAPPPDRDDDGYDGDDGDDGDDGNDGDDGDDGDNGV